MIRAAAGWGACVAGVPFCDIEAAGGTVIFIVPETSCAGRLISADPDWVSLIEWCGCGRGGDMCGEWRGFLVRGLVTSGRRCTGEMEVCHNLLNLLLGLLELMGKLLVFSSQVCHHFRLVGCCLAVGGGSGC